MNNHKHVYPLKRLKCVDCGQIIYEDELQDVLENSLYGIRGRNPFEKGTKMRTGSLLVDIDINLISMNIGIMYDWKWIPRFINEPYGGKNFYQVYWLCFFWSWRIGKSK